MNSPYRFGHVTPAGEDRPFVYSNVWAVEKTNGGSERLIIAPKRDHVALIRKLCELMSPPFWVLYVLLLSRTGIHRAGRYQNPQPLTRKQLAAFLERFRNYLERDARHHVWIAEADGSSLLVYDQHNVIYAYGSLEEFKRLLRETGFAEAPEVRLPVPHSHRYNSEYDSEERALIDYFQWKLTPLQEDDDA